MPYSLLLLPCGDHQLERLGTQLNFCRVTVRSGATRSALERSQPDAVVAPITPRALALYEAICAEAELPARPLLVLVGEPDKPGLPADAVLPAQSLEYSLPPLLKMRAETLARQRRLDEELGRAAVRTREQQQAAEETELLRNVIVRNVSHELRTPLLQIKSAVTMLAEDREEDRAKLTGYAQEATARLEAVFRKISQLAEILEIEAEPVQVSDAVGQAVRDLRRSWNHKDSVDRVQVSVPPDLPPVNGDRQALPIALQELIDNALKFSRREVLVSAHRENGGITIEVRDYGIGIAEDKLGKIFEPFYQVDNSDARRFGGSGVGLSIVRLILERLSSQVTIDSQPGQGSVFSFSLPCVD